MTISLGALRRAGWILTLAILVLATVGIGGLRFNSHYTAYFDEDDPRRVDHENISQRYERGDSIFVVLQSDESFLQSERFRLLEDLASALGEHTFVTRVVSISELGIIGENTGDDDLPIPSLEQMYEHGRAIGLLLSEDTQLTGTWVQVDLPDTNSLTVLSTVGAVRETVAEILAGQPVSAHFTGTLALNEAYIDVVRHDMTRIVPLLLVVMMVVLAVVLRSGRAALTMMPVGILAVIAAFGVVGLAGAELTAINAFVPIIVLTIALAGCVHMALTYSRYRAEGRVPGEAALAAGRYNLLPMALANGTTALGFLGLAFSPSPPVRIVGYLVATGVVVSFLLCISLLPWLQAKFDPVSSAATGRWFFLDALARRVSQQRRMIAAVFLVVSLPAAWLASGNVINDNVFEYFSPSHSFYRDTRLVDEKLSGVNEVLYSLETGETHGLFEADTITAVKSFEDWLARQSEIKRAVSIASHPILEEARAEGRLQQRLDFYRDRIGADTEANPLVALEVGDDFSSVVVATYLGQLDSSAMLEFDRRAHAWAADNLDGLRVTSGGPTLMFASLGERNIRGMLTALTLALIGAALLLGVVLRSVRIAFAGLVCNVLPVLLVYSVWAVLVGQLSIGAAVVMGMILGIVLDDTIYLLTTYRRGLQQGMPEPVRYALTRVGPALVVTTVALIAGLSLGLLSAFGPVWSMSLLSVMIIGTALVVDLLLLPALLPPKQVRSAS